MAQQIEGKPPEVKYPEMPEITGTLCVEKILTRHGYVYQTDYHVGDIVGITLELIQDSSSGLISIKGNKLYFCNVVCAILGYKSPGILVCMVEGDVRDSAD